jgi:hypothetical protein
MHFQTRFALVPLASAASAVATCAVAFISTSAPAGILAHWSFDQIGAPVALESVGLRHGTLLGSAAMVPGGVSGGCLQVSVAGNGVVDMGDILPFVGLQPMTITVWVRTSANPATDQFPVSRHVSGTPNGYLIGIGTSACYGSPGRPWGYRSALCGQEVQAATEVNDGAWHFIAVTYHPNTGQRIYVDGGPWETAQAGPSVTVNAGRFLVGGLTVGASPTGLFDGLIDDRALTCRDIAAMYGAPGTEADPRTPDLDGDGEVAGADLGMLLSSWGTSAADLNGDGMTDGADLGLLLASWGSC